MFSCIRSGVGDPIQNSEHSRVKLSVAATINFVPTTTTYLVGARALLGYALRLSTIDKSAQKRAIADIPAGREAPDRSVDAATF